MERARSRESRGEDSDSDSEQKQHSKSSNSKSSPKLPDTEPTTETSDFDSISTTSASYVVSHSDMESLSLDDHQLDLLMNKSDLSDLDQIDAKTITGSGSSDEDSPRLADGSIGSMESVRNVMDGAFVRPQREQEPANDPGRRRRGDQPECEGQDPERVGGPAEPQVAAAAPAQDTPQAGRSPVSGGRGEGAQSRGSSGDVVRGGKHNVSGAPAPAAPALPSSPSPALLAARQGVASDPVESVRGGCPRADQGKSKAGGVGLAESDRQATPDVPRRKGSVSELIAKFSGTSRSNTPERSITPDSRSLRSTTPDKNGKTAENTEHAS